MRNSSLQPRITLQHILNNHLDQLFAEGLFNSYQRRILRALKQCKTVAQGEHWQACDHCGEVKVHYNSCGNRHCPQCQGVNRERWLIEREHDMFDVAHHHVTFTVPFELRGLFKMNERVLYNILFSSMWATLLSFSQDKRSRLQAEIGVVAILHTWTQKLEYHPHLHCIVPSGGLTATGKWKSSSDKFLFSVRGLSKVFKAKFCEALSTSYSNGELNCDLNKAGFEQFVHLIKKKEWVVNSRPGFKGKQSVLEYLGRYIHKIAISNYRLLKLAKDRVTFSYRDRKAGDVKRVMTLSVKAFLQRFASHILPKGFVKIRHYGLFSTRVKEVKLPLVRKALQQGEAQKKEKLTVAQVIWQTTGVDLSICSSCQSGIMRTFKIIPPSRGDPGKFPQPHSTLTMI